MAKVRVTKVTETISSPAKGPGGRILTDEQVEQWSQFAEKNQNLNFDQKWDTFSKINPKFGASKSDVQSALQKHREEATRLFNLQVQQGYKNAPVSGQFGSESAGLMTTGDTFLPIFENGKIVGRHTEDMGLSSLYPQKPNPESSYLASIFISPSKVPSVDRIQKKSGVIYPQSGLVRFLRDDGTEFVTNLDDLRRNPEYNDLINKQYSNELRSLKFSPESQKLRIK